MASGGLCFNVRVAQIRVICGTKPCHLIQFALDSLEGWRLHQLCEQPGPLIDMFQSLLLLPNNLQLDYDKLTYIQLKDLQQHWQVFSVASSYTCAHNCRFC